MKPVNEAMRPYHWLADVNVTAVPRRIFSEHSESFDLTDLFFDDHVFGGALQSLNEQASEIVNGLDRHDVHAILLMGDVFLWGVFAHRMIDSTDQKSMSTVLDRASRADIAPIVARVFAERFRVADESADRDTECTVSRFFASVALSELHEASRFNHVDWWMINGGFHAMQAAKLVALAQATNRDGSALDDVTTVLHSKAVAQSNARKGWASRPATAAKVMAAELWPEASRKGWTAERMWMELSGAGHSVKADTVRKWITKLRKTGTC